MKQVLTKNQSNCLSELSEHFGIGDIMQLRCDMEEQTQSNAALYEIDIQDLMRALINGYEYEVTTLEKWRRKLSELEKNVSFFGGMDGYVREYGNYRQNLDLLLEVDADFELGIVPNANVGEDA